MFADRRSRCSDRPFNSISAFAKLANLSKFGLALMVGAMGLTYIWHCLEGRGVDARRQGFSVAGGAGQLVLSASEDVTGFLKRSASVPAAKHLAIMYLPHYLPVFASLTS